MGTHLKTRLATIQDLDEILQIQSKVHDISHYDTKEIFVSRINLYPNGCWVAQNNNTIVGYLISHPWVVGDIPDINEIFIIPNNSNCYYIHDIAILPKYRGNGYSRALLKNIIEKNNKLSLIALPRAISFWKKLGFRKSILKRKDKIKRYSSKCGKSALYMTRCK